MSGSVTAGVELSGVVGSLPTTSLDELTRCASLQTRFDRKYLVPPADAQALLEDLGDRLAVLEIGSTRAFRYESLYFDTDDLASYRGAAQRRRRRFKVRVRTYTDSGLTMVEVKTKGGRGETIKQRRLRENELTDDLAVDERTFIDGAIGAGDLASSLRPVLTTRYERTSVVNREDGSRSTLDRALVCDATDGRRAQFDHVFIIETKSTGAATDIDRWLWARGTRPIAFSKFCVGMALLDPSLPAHRWSRVLRRQVGWGPRCDASPG